MLTEYQGKIFNAEVSGNLVNIWKYVPVAGFQKVNIDQDITYYEKTVDISEVSSFFSVNFVAIINDRRFTIMSLKDDSLEVICDDYEYSKNHDFIEIEHGVWFNCVSFDLFNKFLLIKVTENNTDREEVVEELSKNELKEKWSIYVNEVSI